MHNDIVEVSSAQQVLSTLENFQPGALVLFDIDDTIITPSSLSAYGDKFMIDEIKHGPNRPANYMEIVSNWRLQRKVRLLDAQWPAVISQIAKNHTVYAITKMDTGQYGNIPSVEEWRYNELKSLGIDFSHLAPSLPRQISSDAKEAVFYHGILFTGNMTKGRTLQLYRSYLQQSQLVIVDDRMDYLLDIRDYCLRYQISFLGLLFTATAPVLTEEDRKVIAFQKDYLLKHAIWLEDEQAIKAMQSAGLL